MSDVVMSKDALDSYFDDENGRFCEPRLRLLERFGDVTHALLYAELFLPRMIEVENSVILADYIENAIEEFKLARSNTSKALWEWEEAFNLIEVGYLFRSGSNSNDITELALAKLIAESWRGQLRISYPDRKFNVGVYTPEETGSVIGVGFYEVR